MASINIRAEGWLTAYSVEDEAVQTGFFDTGWLACDELLFNRQ